MRMSPTRPNNQISQQYNGGSVTVYSVSDGAETGGKPVPILREKVRLRYEETRLGINRLYLSRQNDAEIERVIRVQRRPDISTQDVAITEDGRRYRIDTIQSVDDVWPRSMDLSLTKVTRDYEVMDDDMGRKDHSGA